MTGNANKSTYTNITEDKDKGYTARTAGELLIVARDASQNYTGVTTPLTLNHVNLECFTTYKWGDETAFRLVTSDNRKAHEILKCAGFDVQENLVTLWYTKNKPGRFNKAVDALAREKIDTFCAYSTAVPNTNTMIIAFTTNDTAKTSEVLSKIR